jgi:phospholipase C
MSDMQRRRLLQLMAGSGLAGAMPLSIQRALAVPAIQRTGTIEDVEHVVVLMQENRSFDHLFGTLRGVRGFADPRAMRLPSGKPVWQQPSPAGDVLPFRPPVQNLGLSFLPDPPHGWNDTHAAWNLGRHDQWVPHKGLSSMTYHTRQDIPYHCALADAFTVCDAYHCSVLGPTDPNRYHLWTGWVGNDGRNGGPVITNAEAGYDWTTFPERLQAAGIPWKVYQDIGVGLTADGFWGWTSDPYIGNYGDNSLLYFHQYQNAPAGSPLAERARTGTNIAALNRDPMRLLDQFRQDVATGRLPAVSWLVAPEAYSEHPNHAADYGAWYTSQVIDILAAHPEVFGKTVLFVNYDEEGGFFDHMSPPVPPSAGRGSSTVDTVNEIFPGDGSHPSGPYGLGMRVPMIVVSPWSKGGWVSSQVFDHTSVIRFIEARFARSHPGLAEPNITPWRRAVTGDLSDTLDFARPEREMPSLPSTAGFVPPELVRHPDLALQVPASQQLPQQEAGVRPARAVPYVLHADAQVRERMRRVIVSMGNTGRQAAVFQLRGTTADGVPRHYTVEPQRLVSDAIDVPSSLYDLELHGPNGFLRGYKGSFADGTVQLDLRTSYDEGRNGITLLITNTGNRLVEVFVRDAYRGQHHRQALRPRESTARHWPLHHSRGWYDLSLSTPADPQFEIRIAGHLENGQESISDPLMGRVRLEG